MERINVNRFSFRRKKPHRREEDIRNNEGIYLSDSYFSKMKYLRYCTYLYQDVFDMLTKTRKKIVIYVKFFAFLTLNVFYRVTITFS